MILFSAGLHSFVTIFAQIKLKPPIGSSLLCINKIALKQKNPGNAGIFHYGDHQFYLFAGLPGVPLLLVYFVSSVI